MATATSTLICPHCQNPISLDEALTSQFEGTVKKQFEQQREKEREEERKKMLEWQEKKAKELLLDVEQRAKKQAEKEIEDLRSKIKEESSIELKSLQEELEKQKLESRKAQENELALRKKANELEEREKNLELEKARQIDEERKKIQEQTAEVLMKEHQMRDAEKNKQMEDMRRKIEELQQKANLTSQQLQGEVQELELEEFLRKEFPTDDIKPVGKGVRGGDVLQVIRDQFGRVCGTVIWESKRTKSWAGDWPDKLKEDMRASKADVAILVSSVLPQGIKFFGPFEGIFVTCWDCLLGVSSQIRLAIIKEAQIKSSVVGKNEKMEIIWNYLSSNQFVQKVEAIVEAFSTMKDDLEKEKRMYTQVWAKREKQIERVINNTIGMHGELQGLMGASLPQITGLTIEETEVQVDDVLKLSSTKTTIHTDNFTQASLEDLL
jgi:hypothetical protein